MLDRCSICARVSESWSMPSSQAARCGLLSLCLLSSACASGGSPAPVEQVALPPAVVTASPPAEDAETLFERGAQALARQEYDDAISIYTALERRFSGSALLPLARYNRCLAYERKRDYVEALSCQRAFIQAHPGSSEFKNAHFRVALIAGKLKRWEEVIAAFQAVLSLQELTAMDTLEAYVGEGVGRFMAGQPDGAERAFRRALDFYAKEARLEDLPADYWIGQSRFYLGEIYARRFEALSLQPPPGSADWAAQVGQALEDKCALLLRAQNNFIRAIRVGHTGWATASGFAIGALYEHLYDALMAVPVPAELDEEARTFYKAELRRRLGVLVKKAIEVYERSLQMAERVGEDNEWVSRTNTSLERMRRLYEEPSGV